MNLSVEIISVKIEKATKEYKDTYIGLVCAINSGEILNCKTYASNLRLVYCTIEEAKIGGICGENRGRIEECENHVYFEVFGIVGGISGSNVTSGEIEDCRNYNRISSFTDCTGEYEGVVGVNKGGLISSCENYGVVDFRTGSW